MRILLTALLLATSAHAAPPLRLLGHTGMSSLIQAVTADQGLVKHLFSVSLGPVPQQFVGLTGNVSLAAGESHFGEELVTVAYLNSGDCAAVNGLTFASYSDANFPPLTHLASFVLKVTLTSFLTLLTAPLPAPRPPPAAAYPLGAEFIELPQPAGGGSLKAAILRSNPALPTRTAIGAIYGSVSVSPFDGTSGEPVPTGPWSSRGDILIYPSAACAAGFAPETSFSGPLHAQLVDLLSPMAPPGGRLLITRHLTSRDGIPVQSAFSQYFPSLMLAPGDCVVTLLGAVGPTNGTLDLEQQATVVVQPLP